MKIKLVLLMITTILAASGISRADPACPDVTYPVEINGEEILLKKWGDEFAHGYETLDGYTVVPDRKNNTWFYAKESADGGLIPSKYIVGKDNPNICF